MNLKAFLKSNIAVALALFLFALGYFYALSCKSYTMVFMSGDSADWLAQAKIWFLPQPFGAPLFIMLAKAVNLIGGNPAKNMVFWLSCLPSAISVVVVYLTAIKLKGSRLIGIVVALVMIGAFPYLAESTVIREHALAAMFISMAVMAWTYKKYWGVLLFMGLATAVNIIPLYITVVWFLADMRKHWRDWVKWSWLFILVGVAPYLLTLWLFTHSDYKWFESTLSLKAISDYLGTAGTVAGLSIADLGSRMVDFIAVIFVSYGIAWIPAVRALKSQWKIALCVLAVFWLYLMDNDPTTWTFTLYAVPFMAVLIATGLKFKKEILLVGLCACALIVFNGFFLNAQTINNKNPMGMELYNDTMALPDNSVVITAQGGFVTLDLFYAISNGKDITLDFTPPPSVDKVGYQSWLAYANSHGLEGADSVMIAHNLLARGIRVFRVTTYLPEPNADAYTLISFNQYFNEVINAHDKSQDITN